MAEDDRTMYLTVCFESRMFHISVAGTRNGIERIGPNDHAELGLRSGSLISLRVERFYSSPGPDHSH